MTFEEVTQQLRSLATAHVGNGATSDEIAEAERALRVVLPRSYKLFLREFGWGGAGHWELYGLGPDVPPYLQLVEMTVSERTEMMPPLLLHLIPIMNDGGGNLFCLDTSRYGPDQECPVVLRDHETGTAEDLSRSFLSWLDDCIRGITIG